MSKRVDHHICWDESNLDKRTIRKISVVIHGKKNSVSLTEFTYNRIKMIASHHNMNVYDLIGEQFNRWALDARAMPFSRFLRNYAVVHPLPHVRPFTVEQAVALV